MHGLWLFLLDFEEYIERVAVQDKTDRMMKSCLGMKAIISKRREPFYARRLSISYRL